MELSLGSASIVARWTPRRADHGLLWRAGHDRALL